MEVNAQVPGGLWLWAPGAGVDAWSKIHVDWRGYLCGGMAGKQGALSEPNKGRGQLLQMAAVVTRDLIDRGRIDRIGKYPDDFRSHVSHGEKEVISTEREKTGLNPTALS